MPKKNIIIGDKPTNEFLKKEIDRLKEKVNSKLEKKLLELEEYLKALEVSKELDEDYKKELASFKESAVSASKEVAERKVKDIVDHLEQIKQDLANRINSHEEKVAKTIKNKGSKKSLSVFKRNFYDIIRKSSYLLSAVGLYPLLTQFLNEGDYSQEAFQALGISALALISAFVQEHFKNARKKQEEENV